MLRTQHFGDEDEKFINSKSVDFHFFAIIKV